MRVIYIFFFFLLLTSCIKNNPASDPFAFAPKKASSLWIKSKRSELLSSKYCKTYLPPSFGNEKLSLAQLIDIGLQNNPETKITWAEARSAAANYGKSLSPYYPRLDLAASYTRMRETFYNTQAFAPFYLTVIDPLVALNYTIFDFGRRKNSSETAKQSLYYADLNHNQTLQNTLKIITDDYYDYAYQKELLVSFKSNLENTEALLDSAKQKYQLGLAALGDVAQARSNNLQAKINVITQKTTLENSYATLANDLGLPATMQFQVEEFPEKTNLDIGIETVDDLIGQAQQIRQDFLASKAIVKAKEAKVREAKSERLPDLAGKFHFGKRHFSNGGGFEDYNFIAQVSLSIPIFRGYFFKNNIKEAQANLEQAKATLFQKELSIFKDVSTSHFEVTTSKENIVYSEDYLESANEQFSIALSNYKVGTNTILDVLSAQSSLADARSKLAKAKKGWYGALIRLAFATGSLCMPGEESPFEELTHIYQP